MLFLKIQYYIRSSDYNKSQTCIQFSGLGHLILNSIDLHSVPQGYLYTLLSVVSKLYIKTLLDQL